MGTVTKNMFAYETDTEILLVDCGIGFPEPTMPGIDLLIPDISYLEDKKDKLVGLLLTHGHDDHIAGLPYILPKLPKLPIFASRLTRGFALDRLKESKLKVDITEINQKPFTVGQFTVQPIKVTHSVPDSRHFAITTPAGIVYHGSDFKFDPHPVDGVVSDYAAMQAVGDQGVVALLSDCLRSERPGESKSESSLKTMFEREIIDTKGKFIVTVMSSNIHRIQQAVDVATSKGRSIAFVGRSVEQNVRTAQQLGFLRLPKAIVNQRKINNFPPHRLCVIIAGSQGQEGSSLTRAIAGEHRNVTINPEDKVVFSTEPIPGNEINVYAAIDELSKTGADVAYSDVDDNMHVSGHASSGELKRLIDLTRPRFLIPIGGTYRHMVQYRKLANKLNYSNDKTLLLDSGQTVEITPNSMSLGQTISIKDIMVDGLGVGDVGNIVLSNRRRMAESGIVIILVVINRSGHMVGKPEVISRGFVYMKQAGKLIKQIIADVSNALPKNVTGKDKDRIKERVEKAATKRIKKETQRDPLVLSVVRQV